MEETIAAVVGFYPAFSSLSVYSLFFIYLHLSYRKQLFLQFSFFPSYPPPSIPACLFSKCTYCPCFPSLPSSLTPEQPSAVSREDPFTQGKKRKCLCYQQRRVNAVYFNIGRNTILFEDCFLFFLHSGFNCARNTNSCLCVRTCIQKGIITTLLEFFFFSIIIYHS